MALIIVPLAVPIKNSPRYSVDLRLIFHRPAFEFQLIEGPSIVVIQIHLIKGNRGVGETGLFQRDGFRLVLADIVW